LYGKNKMAYMPKAAPSILGMRMSTPPKFPFTSQA